MKSYSMATSLDSASLNHLPSARETHEASALWKRFAQLFNMSELRERIAAWMVGPVEPQIYKRYDRRGNVYYRLYDPKSDRHRSFSSEDDVRIWLDQRY